MNDATSGGFPELPINVYCVWQWWEQHYQAARSRPDCVDFDWLDATWMGRTRQLHSWFGDLGIGQATPALDTGFVSCLLPYHTMIVPVLLGMPVSIWDRVGWQNHPLAARQVAKLSPVDLANSPVGELLLVEREKRLRRYGRATQMIDLAGPSNNGFMLRGTEFYLDLLDDPPLARHYLEVITETMLMADRCIGRHFAPLDNMADRFIGRPFDPLNNVALANCNVTMMSPTVYVEMIQPHDIRFVAAAAAGRGCPPRCALHHCNVTTESFAEPYRAIPGLCSLQGSIHSNISAIRAALPEVNFSGMINPVDQLANPPADLLDDIARALASDVHDLVLWDVDPKFTPAALGEFLRSVAQLAARYQRKPRFSFIPMTWEELDWEFPQYHQPNIPPTRTGAS